MHCSKHCQSTESKTLQYLHVVVAALVMMVALQVKTIGGSILAFCFFPVPVWFFERKTYT